MGSSSAWIDFLRGQPVILVTLGGTLIMHAA